jgi:MFS family permease
VPGRYAAALKDLMPLCIAGFSSKIMDSLVWSFLPILLVGLDIGIAEVAAITSAFTFSWALSQPLTGHLSDKLGRRRIILIGLFTSAISILPFMLTENFLLLLILALTLGVEMALFYTPLIAMVSDIAPPALEGTLIGSYRFFRDMGYFVGPILLGEVADAYGLNYAFYVASLSLFIAMVVLYFSSKETLMRIVQEPKETVS